MASATCAVKCVAATVSRNKGATSNVVAGALTLTLVFEATAAPSAAVPLNAGKGVSSSDPQEAKGMVGKELTLTFDDTTGAITDLA